MRPAPARPPDAYAPGQQVTGASGASRQQVPKVPDGHRPRPPAAFRLAGEVRRPAPSIVGPRRASSAPGAAPTDDGSGRVATDDAAPRGACSSASTRRRAPQVLPPGSVLPPGAVPPCSGRLRCLIRRWPTSIENPLPKKESYTTSNRSTTKLLSPPRREARRSRGSVDEATMEQARGRKVVCGC